MRKVKLKIHDPDDFFRKARRFGDLETKEENSAEFSIVVQEGELPPRPPTFTYEVVDE
jgi:hypothetical protein